jgi:hypothetical protein
MGVRSIIVTLLASCFASGLVACGGTSVNAKLADADPWADYKGTYATAAAPRVKVAQATVAPKEAAARVEATPPAPAVEEKTAAATTPARSPAKKAKWTPKKRK